MARWPPPTITLSVNKSSELVYGSEIAIVNGVYTPTDITGGATSLGSRTQLEIYSSILQTSSDYPKTLQYLVKTKAYCRFFPLKNHSFKVLEPQTRHDETFKQSHRAFWKARHRGESFDFQHFTVNVEGCFQRYPWVNGSFRILKWRFFTTIEDIFCGDIPLQDLALT